MLVIPYQTIGQDLDATQGGCHSPPAERTYNQSDREIRVVWPDRG